MVLRKPYAFFIKHFRLFHFIIFGLVVYSIVRATGVINFISQYLSSANSVNNLITADDVASVFNNFDYFVSIITFIMSLIMLVVMTMKQKKNKFYAYSTVMSIIMIILNVHGKNTFNSMTKIWLSSIELETLSNLYLFAIMALIGQASIALSRGVGFNISRFDFNSDLIKLQADESDNEEVEFVVDFDVNDLKRGIQKKSRYVKYFIKENSKTLLWCFGVFGGIAALYFVFSMFKGKVDTISPMKLKNQNINGMNVQYNDAYIINTDSKGNKLEDSKILLVVDLTLKNNSKDARALSLASVNVMLGDNIYTSALGYQNKVIDLGKVYSGEKIKEKRYKANGDPVISSKQALYVFEVPEGLLWTKNLYLQVLNININKPYYIKLSPKNLVVKETKEHEGKFKEDLLFEGSVLKDSKLTIDSIEIKDKYVLTYDKNLKEYIPNNIIETNEEMAVMKLKGTFDSKNTIISDLKSLINNYSYIEYKIGDKTYKQTNGFMFIEPKRVKENNTYYFTVHNNIRKADSAKLVFSIRGNEYVYSLNDVIKGGN